MLRRLTRLSAAATVALAAALVAAPGMASVADHDQRIREAQEQADRAEQDLDAISSEATAVRDELVAIEDRLAQAEGRLRTLEGQAMLAEQELEARAEVADEAAAAAVAAAEELARIESDLVRQEALLGDQLAEAWIHGSTANGPAMVYELLRSSDNPSDFAADLYRIRTVLDAQAGVVTSVESLRGQQADAVDEARETRLRAERLREDAAQAVALVQGLRDQAAAVQADVQADRDRQATVLASLEADADQARKVLASVKAEQDRIEAERQADLAAAEQRRQAQEQAAQEQSAGSDGGDTSGGGGTPSSGPCPVDGARAERDFTNDWGYPRPGGRSHEGTDIFANRGTPVRSIGSGTVKEVRYTDSGLGGLYVSIWVASGEHWYYAHLDSITGGLAPGVAVSDGQQIGTVGNSGNARTTPPHLHIGHYFNDVAENPYPVLARRCP